MAARYVTSFGLPLGSSMYGFVRNEGICFQGIRNSSVLLHFSDSSALGLLARMDTTHRDAKRLIEPKALHDLSFVSAFSSAFRFR